MQNRRGNRMSWTEYFYAEFANSHNGEITKYENINETQLNKQLKGVIHTNRNGEEVDVRKINRRYATNLYYWYWKQAKDYMEEKEFNATFMGNILYRKMEVGKYDIHESFWASIYLN